MPYFSASRIAYLSQNKQFLTALQLLVKGTPQIFDMRLQIWLT